MNLVFGACHNNLPQDNIDLHVFRLESFFLPISLANSELKDFFKYSNTDGKEYSENLFLLKLVNLSKEMKIATIVACWTFKSFYT